MLYNNSNKILYNSRIYNIRIILINNNNKIIKFKINNNLNKDLLKSKYRMKCKEINKDQLFPECNNNFQAL